MLDVAGTGEDDVQVFDRVAEVRTHADVGAEHPVDQEEVVVPRIVCVELGRQAGRPVCGRVDAAETGVDAPVDREQLDRVLRTTVGRAVGSIPV